MVAGAVAALAIAGAVGAATDRNTRQLIATEHAIAHADEVLEAVGAAVGLVKDAEIAVRGYLITADDDLAQRGELARPALMHTLAHLRALVADNPEQQEKVVALDTAVRAKLAYSDDVLRRRRDGEIGIAELDGRLAESMRRTDEIGGLAAQVEHVERRLLAERQQTAHPGTDHALAALRGGFALGVGMLIAALVLLDREVRRRRTAEAELVASQRHLNLALDASQMALWDLERRTLRHDQIRGYATPQPDWSRAALLRLLVSADRAIEQRAFATAFATLVEHHGGAPNGESRRVLDVIRANTHQMGRLIDDLLQFSRVGRGAVEKTRVDVAALAGSIVGDLRRAEPDRKVAVRIGALPSALGDDTMLRQVLGNLLGNAWKFTRRQADATIELGSTTEDDRTVYFVRDNGAGFDMKDAGKLFDVFERLHTDDDFEGTGVGLAIVQRVLQRHGGRVWAEAAVDRGATFYFTLPNRRADDQAAHERGDPGGGRSGGPGAPRA
jgi:signal transduction histidine kinase